MAQLLKNQPYLNTEKHWDNDEMLLMQCKAMNEQKGNLKGYDCPKCKNKGYIYVIDKENLSQKTRLCDCRKIRENYNRMRRSGLGDLAERYTFNSFKTDTPLQRQMKEKALKFTKEAKARNGVWLFVGGMSGSGKTHICTAISNELSNSALNVKYLKWAEEATKIKSVVNDRDEYEKLVAPLKNCDVLYIDDFFRPAKDEYGKGRPPSQADIRLAYEILNYRYNLNDTITIISSEQSLDEIIDLDTAIGGRINQRAEGYIMNISNRKENNYRLRKHK